VVFRKSGCDWLDELQTRSVQAIRFISGPAYNRCSGIDGENGLDYDLLPLREEVEYIHAQAGGAEINGNPLAGFRVIRMSLQNILNRRGKFISRIFSF
jgi:hypothetical protein